VRVPGHPDQLLQSTYTGLVRFQQNQDGHWMFQGRVDSFAEPLKKIAFDAQGQLWGAHPNRGLYRLQLLSDLSQVRSSYLFQRGYNGLSTDFQLGLSTMNNNLIINALPVALRAVLSSDDVVFEPIKTPFPARKWLPGHAGDAFLIDSTNLWLVTPQGAPRKVPVRLVPGFEQVIVVDSTSYLFCLENGFAILRDAGHLAFNKVGPTLVTAIETAQRGVFAPIEKVVLDYAQNSVKLYFSASFYEYPLRFSWRLEGFSEHWSAWSDAAEKEFTNLSPGHYRFHVRSDLGTEEAVLEFWIKPPWWRSNWAVMVYVCLLGAALWAVEWLNRRRLERQRLRLEAEKERELLVLEVENQDRELSNAAFNLIRKNEAMQALKDDLLSLPPNSKTAIHKIARRIDAHLEGDHDWEIFEASFNRVHDDFIKRLMRDYPELTPGDMRLAAYLKMNLNSKEIAPLLNISVRGVENKRYRLRKKLGLPEDANLTEFILVY
jgi:DNA-binding CsgD family transcriptional regulator